MEINFRLNDQELKAAIAQINEKTNNFQPLMTAIGATIELAIDDGFKNESAPNGTAWAALSVATIRYKQRHKLIPKKLQARGQMRATLISRVTSDRVEIGFNKFYAQFHQIGTYKMPKRQLIPEERDLAPGTPLHREIVELAEDFLKGLGNS